MGDSVTEFHGELFVCLTSEEDNDMDGADLAGGDWSCILGTMAFKFLAL